VKLDLRRPAHRTRPGRRDGLRDKAKRLVEPAAKSYPARSDPRLARAYNAVAPPRARLLSGGSRQRPARDNAYSVPRATSRRADRPPIHRDGHRRNGARALDDVIFEEFQGHGERRRSPQTGSSWRSAVLPLPRTSTVGTRKAEHVRPRRRSAGVGHAKDLHRSRRWTPERWRARRKTREHSGVLGLHEPIDDAPEGLNRPGPKPGCVRRLRPLYRAASQG